MRDVKKMWFVIDTKKDWSQQWINEFDTEEEARKSAEFQWDCLTDKEKLKRVIHVAEMDAVYDKDEMKWMPVQEWDEEYEQSMSYIGSYDPTLVLSMDDKELIEELIKVYVDTINGITKVDNFDGMPDGSFYVNEQEFVDSLGTLGEDEVIGSEISKSTYEKLDEEYGIRVQ